MRRAAWAVAAIAIVVGISGPRAAAAPTADPAGQRARLTQDGWWERQALTSVLAPVVDPVTALLPKILPLPEPPVLDGAPVPADAIAVALQGGSTERVAAVGIELLPADRLLTTLRLTLQQVTSGSTADLAGARVVACPITAAWTSSTGGPADERPPADCDLAAVEGQRADDGRWTFDLTPMLSLWQPGGGVEPHGVLLEGEGAAGTTGDYQIAFADVSTGTATIETTAATDAALATIGPAAPTAALPSGSLPAEPVPAPGDVATDAARRGPTETGSAAQPATGEVPAAADLTPPTPVVDLDALAPGTSALHLRWLPVLVLVLAAVGGAVGLALVGWRVARVGFGSPTGRMALGVLAVGVLVVPAPGVWRAIDLAASRAVMAVAGPMVGPIDALAPLPPTTEVLDRDGQPVGDFTSASRRPVHLTDLPDHVTKAVLAAEDAGFYDHAGVDPAAIGRALLRNITGGREGGSTIVQQLVKLNYLDAEPSIVRKLEEIPYAAHLEDMYSKDELLERYLNQVYFGDGAYGIGAAATEFFGVPAEQLTVAQAAMLAGKIHAPVALDPRRHPDAVLNRRNHVLDLMRDAGWLSEPARAAAVVEPLGVRAATIDLTAYAGAFVRYVQREVADLDRRATRDGALVTALETGGYTIETTLDQRALAAATTAAGTLGTPGDPTVALASVEPGDGAVRVLFGGLDPTRSFDVASQGRRPAGSMLNPFIEVAARQLRAREAADGALAPDAMAKAIASVAQSVGIADVDRVSPLELAGAYATIAAGGTYAPPYAVRRITDRDGRVVYEHQPFSAPVIDGASADNAAEAMRHGGTVDGSPSDIGARAGASSGRTDAWYAGFVPQLATAVWAGVPDCSVPVPGMVDDNGGISSGATATVYDRYITSAVDGVENVPVAPPSAAPDRSAPLYPIDPDADAMRASVLAALQRSTATQTAVLVDVDGLGPVVDVNSTEALAPASTLKLYTASAALLRLGADTQLRTTVSSTVAPGPDGVVHGDLVVTPVGDPTLTRDDLQALAAAVVAGGVRHVTGGVVVAAGAVDEDATHAQHVPSDLGPLAEFAVDGNRWRCDAPYLADPAVGNGNLFGALLARAGVTIDGPARASAALDAPLVPLAAHDSAPMADIVQEMLRTSDSFSAELLLRRLGGAAGDPTRAGGVDVLSATAAALGEAATGWYDASGLSSNDRDTAAHQVEWLKRMEATPVADDLWNGFAVACESGTLAHRFCGTPAAGRVWAKTGTLAHSVNMAGYTETPSGRRVRFSILLSGVTSNADAQRALDDAITAIASGEVPIINHIRTSAPEIFITVDDGWDRDPRVLELVQRLHLPLTAFLIGKAAEEDPDYFRALEAGGAVVEDHTATHQLLDQLTYEEQVREICGGNELVGGVAGHPTTLLRPPYGAQNPATRSAASACGLDAVVMWSASMDKGELHAVDGRLHPGDIVLLHFDEHLYGDLVQLLDLAAQSGLSVGRLEDHVGANQALPTY